MEAVLDLYAKAPEHHQPMVCFDECSYQMVAETRKPLPAKPGCPERFDYEYERQGTCNLFMMVAPHLGWRHVAVTQRRTKQDFAWQMRALVDEHFPRAHKIHVVLDNLNTHTGAALYEAFDPATAHRLLERLEFHYTPKHGSWLNMAEIELSVLAGQCLHRRLPSREEVDRQVEAWERERNQQKVKIKWQFTTRDARRKLKRLYPS
jgi:transposase